VGGFKFSVQGYNHLARDIAVELVPYYERDLLSWDFGGRFFGRGLFCNWRLSGDRYFGGSWFGAGSQ
jgi:hypothetical protein